MVVFGDQVTKILHNANLFTFLTEEGKTGKSGSHENENLAIYFGIFGIFDKNQLTKIPCCPSMTDYPGTGQNFFPKNYINKKIRETHCGGFKEVQGGSLRVPRYSYLSNKQVHML